MYIHFLKRYMYAMFKLNVNKKCYYSVVVVVIFVVATIYICAVDMLHFKNLTIV